MKLIAAAALFILGCSAAPKAAAPPAAPPAESLADRRAACADLYDHLVTVSVNDKVREEGARPSRKEYEAFREMWAEELEERGVKDRFTYYCLSEMERPDVECVRKAQTIDSLKACTR